MQIQGKRILVTAGTGFIGSHTVDALVEKGAQVVTIDRTGRECNLNPGAKCYKLNIADPRMEDIFKEFKPQIIYHFAFNVLVPKSVENPLLDIDSVIGSINIMENIKKYGGEKIVFASSGFIYGNTSNIPIPETEPFRSPTTPFVVAKRAVENYLQYYRSAFNISSVILRYATVYGPRQATGAMVDYIRTLNAGKNAQIWGDGTKTRDYIYVDDVVRANLAALDLPADYPSPYFNVGTGKENTLNEIYHTIASILGREAKPIYLPDRPGETIRFALDNSKIKKALGWEPLMPLNTGLQKTVDFYLKTKS